MTDTKHEAAQEALTVLTAFLDDAFKTIAIPANVLAATDTISEALARAERAEAEATFWKFARTGHDSTLVGIDRETLGREVREAWVRWAVEQPSPKASWLVSYDQLSEPDKEADRQIGEHIAGYCHAALPAAQAELASLRSKLSEAEAGGSGIYAASKAAHFDMWRAFRSAGQPIISTWIDEDADKATKDFSDLWARCIAEAAGASAVILYRESGEVLKGALLEIGAAMARGRPVFAVGDFDGTYHNHPLFHPCATLDDAFRRAAAFKAEG